mmetsp:Transcript_20475/g.47872  ORF Transcript_20475/g.47872 Transcript_20475/m.47872 type:complete len:228 (+) Transcript_20475:273-956(+)
MCEVQLAVSFRLRLCENKVHIGGSQALVKQFGVPAHLGELGSVHQWCLAVTGTERTELSEHSVNVASTTAATAGRLGRSSSPRLPGRLGRGCSSMGAVCNRKGSHRAGRSVRSEVGPGDLGEVGNSCRILYASCCAQSVTFRIEARFVGPGVPGNVGEAAVVIGHRPAGSRATRSADDVDQFRSSARITTVLLRGEHPHCVLKAMKVQFSLALGFRLSKNEIDIRGS